MSEAEIILRQESGVKDHESKSPPTMGLKAGAFAELGTLILTNKRLVYISKGGAAHALAWGIGGVFAAQAIKTNVSKAQIDELSTQKGSYYTSLENITLVEAGKKMGESYIHVDSIGSNKPVHAYVVGGGNSNQEWAAAINQAKANLQSTPTAQTENFVLIETQKVIPQSACQKCGAANSGNSKFCTSCGTPLNQTQAETPRVLPPPPPPPPTQTPLCPNCRSPIRYIQQYQRWYCDNEQRYI
ncbi:MAG: zinc-ribbon domain-containing protein [Candidatus Bathyarchaeota archaeon]|nr:zinc-ribbon domain-containing protein [Candidatus Bathyarchaeota archaeon]